MRYLACIQMVGEYVAHAQQARRLRRQAVVRLPTTSLFFYLILSNNVTEERFPMSELRIDMHPSTLLSHSPRQLTWKKVRGPSCVERLFAHQSIHHHFRPQCVCILDTCFSRTLGSTPRYLVCIPRLHTPQAGNTTRSQEEMDRVAKQVYQSSNALSKVDIASKIVIKRPPSLSSSPNYKSPNHHDRCHLSPLA